MALILGHIKHSDQTDGPSNSALCFPAGVTARAQLCT